MCDGGSLAALIVLILSSVPMTYIAARIASKEYKEK